MASQLTDREREVWRTFSAMRRQLDVRLERRLQADAGISSADWEILLSLHEQPTARLRAGRISDIIGWEKSRVSHQLSRMQQRGLITREECGDDARGIWVVLTDDGRAAVLAAVADRVAAVREYFFDAITDDQQQALLAVSRGVLEVIDPAVCAPDAAHAVA